MQTSHLIGQSIDTFKPIATLRRSNGKHLFLKRDITPLHLSINNGVKNRSKAF